ncbi:MAG: hypothetical protein QOG64_2010 [Acidimicrobiaceae bacterium]|nr:hypothetical protein [Acidimicrobiaceae bacterium]
MRRARLLAAVGVLGLLTGPSASTSPHRPTVPTPAGPERALAAAAATTAANANANANAAWRLTTYYTAVEQYHRGPLTPVHGCPRRECEHGGDDLGRYPSDFVAAVKDEGTGRITSGPNVGRYLNWSYDVGYWLDTIPTDTNGDALAAFETAAADAVSLAPGTEFVIAGCGTQQGDPLEADACRRFQSSRWIVRDAFTPGLGGSRHLDLYIGEEDRRGFTDSSPIYVDVTGARITVAPADNGRR